MHHGFMGDRSRLSLVLKPVFAFSTVSWEEDLGWAVTSYRGSCLLYLVNGTVLEAESTDNSGRLNWTNEEKGTRLGCLVSRLTIDLNDSGKW